MDLKSLGYKKTFVGENFWHWKVTNGTNEYLICDEGRLFLVSQWNGHKFVNNSTLTKEEIEVLKNRCKTEPKEDRFIEDDDNWTTVKGFYTVGSTVEKEPELEYSRKRGNYSSDEVNELLEILLRTIYLCGSKRKDELYITKEIIGEDSTGLLNDFLDYKIGVKKEGSHRNDGQMVEYCFSFLSPDGKKFTLTTEMCLMVGFNYNDPLILPER